MGNEFVWNPWHGCIKYSEGCQNCYVYRRDASIGKDASLVVKNAGFDLPIRKKRDGSFKIPDGSTVYACMTSDFFLEQADAWRPDVWDMIRRRAGVRFLIITKRIARFEACIPPDWGTGYPNVEVCCTVESQKQCDIRLPIFSRLPIRAKSIICSPLLTDIDMRGYLNRGVSRVVAGGESGSNARICKYDWVLHLRAQCIACNVPFFFQQTGARFVKDGRLYRIPRRLQHAQARRAGINTKGREG